MSANAQGSKLRRITSAEGNWLPNQPATQANYFSDLSQYLPMASRLAQQVGVSSADNALGIREHELPGYTQGLRSQFNAYNDLAQGKWTPEMLANAQRTGGAGTVGLGMGGSGFGGLNTALFGARSTLGTMEAGQSLLGTLLGSMPQFQTPTPTSFLSSLVTPEQSITNQLQVRNQNVGLEGIAAGVPYGGNVMGNTLGALGGMATGAGLQALFSPNSSSNTSLYNNKTGQGIG